MQNDEADCDHDQNKQIKVSRTTNQKMQSPIPSSPHELDVVAAVIPVGYSIVAFSI
jgi:hypothetical protein